MNFSDKQGQIIGGMVAFIVIILGFVLWKRTTTLPPAIPPGQTLLDPLGGQPAPTEAPEPVLPPATPAAP